MTEDQRPEMAGMTEERIAEERITELFLYCVGLLRVDDTGLLAGHDVADLNAVACLCKVVKSIAIVPRDPHDVLLFELADATEDLITTAVLPPEGDVVDRWTKARVAVLQNGLGAM